MEYLTFGLLVIVAIGGSISWIKDWEFRKKLTIHDIAFKTKFETYQKIWKAVLGLRKAAVIPDIETKFADYEDKLDKATVAWHDAFVAVEENKPFYKTGIYGLCNSLNDACREHINTFKAELEKGSLQKSFWKGEELVETMKELVPQIEEAIRKEIV